MDGKSGLASPLFYYESKERFHNKDGHAAGQTAWEHEAGYYESKERFHSKDGHAADQTAWEQEVGYYESKREWKMSRREEYEAKFEKLLIPIAEASGVEIYDVEYVKEGSDWYLRAYIDKEGGVTIDDCEKVSRRVSDLMDEEDFIEDAYILEVSSPGLGRALKKDKHLARSMGEKVELKTYKPIDKQKDFFGTLKAFDESSVTVETEDGKSVKFLKSDVALIRLAVDF